MGADVVPLLAVLAEDAFRLAGGSVLVKAGLGEKFVGAGLGILLQVTGGRAGLVKGLLGLGERRFRTRNPLLVVGIERGLPFGGLMANPVPALGMLLLLLG